LSRRPSGAVVLVKTRGCGTGDRGQVRRFRQRWGRSSCSLDDEPPGNPVQMVIVQMLLDAQGAGSLGNGRTAAEAIKPIRGCNPGAIGGLNDMARAVYDLRLHDAGRD